MAIAVVGFENGKALQDALRAYPTISKKFLQRAVAAGAAEVQKAATRENVPWRTGNLVQSFGNGITIGELYARISPTASYAIYVHEGTKNIKKPNKFMPRIAEAAQPQVNKHFQSALGQITDEIAKSV